MRFGLRGGWGFAYAIMAVCIIAMVSSWNFWWIWAPLLLALAGAVVATDSASRTAGIVACISWTIFAAIGRERVKFYGPLGCFGFSSLAVAATAAVAPKLARTMLVPVAFVGAMWITALARQIVFEISTVGEVTAAFDSCTAALLPYLLAALLVFVFGAGAFLLLLRWLGARIFPSSEDARSRWGSYVFVFAVAAALASGATFGFATWQDWQINRPCL